MVQKILDKRWKQRFQDLFQISLISFIFFLSFFCFNSMWVKALRVRNMSTSWQRSHEQYLLALIHPWVVINNFVPFFIGRDFPKLSVTYSDTGAVGSDWYSISLHCRVPTMWNFCLMEPVLIILNPTLTTSISKHSQIQNPKIGEFLEDSRTENYEEWIWW